MFQHVWSPTGWPQERNVYRYVHDLDLISLHICYIILYYIILYYIILYYIILYYIILYYIILYYSKF